MEPWKSFKTMDPSSRVVFLGGIWSKWPLAGKGMTTADKVMNRFVADTFQSCGRRAYYLLGEAATRG